MGYPWAADKPLVTVLLQLPGLRAQLEHDVALFLPAYSPGFLPMERGEGKATLSIRALSKQGAGGWSRGTSGTGWPLEVPGYSQTVSKRKCQSTSIRQSAVLFPPHMLLCRFITSQTILIKTGIISTVNCSSA